MFLEGHRSQTQIFINHQPKWKLTLEIAFGRGGPNQTNPHTVNDNVLSERAGLYFPIICRKQPNGRKIGTWRGALSVNKFTCLSGGTKERSLCCEAGIAIWWRMLEDLNGELNGGESLLIYKFVRWTEMWKRSSSEKIQFWKKKGCWNFVMFSHISWTVKNVNKQIKFRVHKTE